MKTSREEFVAAVTAPEGYRLLLIDRDAIAAEVPVIAFGLWRRRLQDWRSGRPAAGGGYVYGLIPITIDGPYDDDSQEYALQRPDGTAEIPLIETFPSKDELVAFLAARGRKSHERPR
jgi:hypothetical protein